jgi:hypothetical protein
VAAQLDRDLHVTADLVVGRRGEFSVWVGGRKVAEKTFLGFPPDDQIAAAVKKALAQPA